MNADAALLRDRPRYGTVRQAFAKVLYAHHIFQHWQRRHRIVLERIDDETLVVLPGVLNPRLTRTGAFFASQLTAEVLTAGSEVLDMGTGSGICALVAARQGARVVAVDINPTAVRCAHINALLSEHGEQIDVLEGDLFAPVAQRRFDAVLFNPPFLHGAPRNHAERAWRSTDVAERFATQLRGHLKPGGFALVLLSTFGNATANFIAHFERAGLHSSVHAERGYLNERLTLFKVT